ncbi:MAG: glycosyltransferase [Deltaproteobacteria bacterium]|nr:glycosyltransferase [Deltaproteobacteria bacterium]
MNVFQQPTTVSVVICTLNREEPLIHVLELLKDQSIHPLEVLVIDQSSEHQSTTRHYLRENQGRIRLLTLSSPSTTAARNLARREVKGDLVLFLDDDVLFYPTLIQNHLENYQDPALGAVTGKVLYDGSEENDLPWAARITRSGKYLRNFNTNQRCLIPTLYGCNMSIRRDVLVDVGEFDLNYWGNFLWEEVDYALQIRKHGYQILYDPRAAVFHVMAKKGGSRNPLPRQYLESTIFNDWYFFFKYISARFWPFLIYRQKRTWLQYIIANK